MRSLLRRMFIENWQRKLVSLILAMIIWMVVHHSMTVTKTVTNIPVKILNLPRGKTVEGLGPYGTLTKKIALTFTGNKGILEELTGSDIQVVIDAQGKTDEWIASIGKKNLVSLNPDFDLLRGISKVSHHDFIIKLSKLVTEKIPVVVTQPIGEAPKGYQFLDIWPYQFHLTLTGPEEAVKKLKAKGLKLTFNLSDISRAELDALMQQQKSKYTDEISFFVPERWKRIRIPFLSDTPYEIDDSTIKALRIDFARKNLLPIEGDIPIEVYFPPKYSETLNPNTYSLATNKFIQKKNGIKMLTAPLFAHGVSKLFLDIMKDHMQIAIIAAPKSERQNLLWHIQFLSPHDLEDLYVAKVLSQGGSKELYDLQPHLREEYLRNRFRSYMNRFRLYTMDDQKLSLDIELMADAISVTSKTPLNLSK